MWKLIFGWLLFVNLAAYAVYWWDKRRARSGGRRIPERELLMWVVAGGAIGALLAMRRFRHKTRKVSFRLAFWGIVAVQIAGFWFLLQR